MAPNGSAKRCSAPKQFTAPAAPSTIGNDWALARANTGIVAPQT